MAKGEGVHRMCQYSTAGTGSRADGERVGSADHDPPCVVGCQAIAGRDARLSIRSRGYKTGSRRYVGGRKYYFTCI
jgi:hypothetical protein